MQERAINVHLSRINPIGPENGAHRLRAASSHQSPESQDLASAYLQVDGIGTALQAESLYG